MSTKLNNLFLKVNWFCFEISCNLYLLYVLFFSLLYTYMWMGIMDFCRMCFQRK